MLEAREKIDSAMNSLTGQYPDLQLANKYLNLAPKRKNTAGEEVYPSTILIKIPKPLIKGERRQFFTRSFKFKKSDSAPDFIEEVRKKRNLFFEDLYGKPFHRRNLKNKTVSTPTSAGWAGVTLKSTTLEYKVSYIDDASVRRYVYVSIIAKRGDTKAYLEACRKSDKLNGRRVSGDDVYLAAKKLSVSDDVVRSALKERDYLRDVKSDFSGTKKGIELSIVYGRYGFFVKTWNKQLKKIESVLVSAHAFGEDEAFVEACRLCDEINGEHLLSDEEYLKLKPSKIFTSL